MGGGSVFVDTNILLYFLKGDEIAVNMISDKDIVISFITELELLSFPGISVNEKESIIGLLSNCQVIDINNQIKELTIELRKKTHLKLPDSIIAASAYFKKLPLLTADKQFKTVKELDIIIYDV